MIVNRYEAKAQVNMSLHTLDTFCLWNTREGLKNVLHKDSFEKYEKWILSRYQYEVIKKETDSYLKENYDKDPQKLPLFSSVEIEIINRCNGECPFCPVNKHQDPRKLKKMDEKLFKKIIDELKDMNYSGRLALHSNNEPFLDDRIIEFTKYARENLPKAFIYMFTNGTLVTKEKFQAIIPYLDRMVIDNYDDELKLHNNAQIIHELCRANKKLNKKVEIHVRKMNEVLNTRGGQSPNNTKRETYHMSCILPYKQMVIRPDGKVSLCCNDPYGKYTMADLNKMSLKEAWYSKRYMKLRKALRHDRKHIRLCQYCDTLPGPNGY